MTSRGSGTRPLDQSLTRYLRNQQIRKLEKRIARSTDETAKQAMNETKAAQAKVLAALQQMTEPDEESGPVDEG